MNKFSRFLAIDFETANYSPASACAVGLVTVDHCEITRKKTYFIRPPHNKFVFTSIHGITWKDVRTKRTFGQLWEELASHFEGIDFIAAHNASFDRRVLQECCSTYGIEMPDIEFRCTVKLSRSILGIRPANLSNVCRELGIALNHHEAGSDSEACARIMIQVLQKSDEGAQDNGYHPFIPSL